MWDEKELSGVEFIPEPTDLRIVSAADPSTIGHQDKWRSEIVGWAPEPIVVLPRRVRNTQRIIVNTGVMLIVFLVLWALWNAQFILEISPQKSEWAYEDSGVRELQDSGLTGDGIRVCMVDTGIDISHPDLSNIDLEFKDFVGSSTEPVDHGNLAHGTLMAGILVADGYMEGVAPSVTFGMAAALGDNGEGSNSGDERLVADAIDWCRAVFNADIISLSLGGEIDPNATREGPSGNAVHQALSNGIYVVAAAGNDGGENDDGRVASPSHIDGVISVGASAENGSIWTGSSIGASVDSSGNVRTAPNQKPEITAPGVDILSTGPNGEYYTSTGTSDSTVFVSGILALILEAEPDLRQPSLDCIEDMKMALMNSVTASSGNVHDNKAGYGAINGQNWLEEIKSTETCS